MTERQDLAAEPASWADVGGPVSADPGTGAARTATETPGPGATGMAGLHSGPAARAADEPYARVDARKLEAALLGLRKPLVAASLPLAAPAVEAARAERLKLLSQIDDYLLPRLRQSGAPILVALVGSTGAGKSTLLNSLAGQQVSATGIRRPTTNSPVLACHPNDMRWFAENVFLPTLPRVRQQGLVMPGRDGLLVLAGSEGMPEGVAVLDTPDIDSVVKAHRDFAHQFLDASDLWLFVTTARRYADAAVWDMLKDARDRGAALALALSRVPPAATREVAAHFDAMLQANGLREVRRFVIPETVVTEARLPAEISAPVKEYLSDTARRDDRRVAVLTQTMSGVLDTFRDRVPALADHISAQLTLSGSLRAAAATAHAAALAEFSEAIANGSLLRGEILTRWQDFAGAGDLLKTLQVRRGRAQVGRTRKRRRPATAEALKTALQTSVESLIAVTADRAAERTVATWQASPAGATLLARSPIAAAQSAEAGEAEFVASALADLGLLRDAAPDQEAESEAMARATSRLGILATRAVSAWHDHVVHIVHAENVTRRSIARTVAFDDESLALVLMVGALGHGTAGNESQAVTQELLASLFGAGLLRDLSSRVRRDLRERVRPILDGESRRFAALIEHSGTLDAMLPTQLLQAGFTLEDVR